MPLERRWLSRVLQLCMAALLLSPDTPILTSLTRWRHSVEVYLCRRLDLERAHHV